MPEIARKVVVDLAQKKLFINGDEFPWAISEGGVSLTALGSKNELQGVSFTMFADDVEVLPAGKSNLDPDA